MGVLQRFADIMSANINDLLDKAEDPAKMIDQALRNAKEDLAEVKMNTASVMAQEKSAKRVYENALAIEKQEHEYAVKALKAGDEAAAAKFLQSEKAKATATEAALRTYEAAKANSEKMQQMYNKLVSDIQSMEARRDNVKATMSVAKATERVNNMKMPSSNNIDAFRRYEDKAQAALDKAQSAAELDMGPVDEMEALRDKYDTGNVDVSADLAKLKAELGL